MPILEKKVQSASSILDHYTAPLPSTNHPDQREHWSRCSRRQPPQWRWANCLTKPSMLGRSFWCPQGRQLGYWGRPSSSLCCRWSWRWTEKQWLKSLKTSSWGSSQIHKYQDQHHQGLLRENDELEREAATWIACRKQTSRNIAPWRLRNHFRVIIAFRSISRIQSEGDLVGGCRCGILSHLELCKSSCCRGTLEW